MTYAWSGVLQPINADGSSVFKAGSTVPVKFTFSGSCAPGLVAYLAYGKINDGEVGPVNEAESISAATLGNRFRFDAGSGQFIYNWSTKGLSPGTYPVAHRPRRRDDVHREPGIEVASGSVERASRLCRSAPRWPALHGRLG